MGRLNAVLLLFFFKYNDIFLFGINFSVLALNFVVFLFQQLLLDVDFFLKFFIVVFSAVDLAFEHFFGLFQVIDNGVVLHRELAHLVGLVFQLIDSFLGDIEKFVLPFEIIFQPITLSL